MFETFEFFLFHFDFGSIKFCYVSILYRICAETSSCAHSQASSLAEDCIDSYVPIQSNLRSSNEEYIDMESKKRQHALMNNTSSLSSAASSCSITSGTPSTDIRFAEYQLDKVVSHFTPDDDDPKYVLLTYLIYRFKRERNMY